MAVALPDWDAEAPPPLLGVGAGTNLIGTVTCGPFCSPNASTHESPADSCVGVGGHGYFAASLAGAFPALSVAGHGNRAGEGPQGGPDVGEIMLKVFENVPSAPTVTRLEVDGALQLTGIFSPIEEKSTVGWLWSLLHSSTAPAPVAKPTPVTVTLVPPFRHVAGFAVMLGGPPTDVAEAALQGTVVVVVELVVVELVVVEPVVVELVVVELDVVVEPLVVLVVPPPLVVEVVELLVVVVPPPPLEKEMFSLA